MPAVSSLLGTTLLDGMGWAEMGYSTKLYGALLASIAVPVPAGGTACPPTVWEKDRLKIIEIAKCWTVLRIQISAVKEGNERYFTGSHF